MITKIILENIKLGKYRIKKVDVNFIAGLNIFKNGDELFIEDLFKYILDREKEWYRLKYLLEIKPLDSNDLSYITMCCEYEGDILKYSSTYDNGKIFSETLRLGNNLIGNWDYSEDELEKGILYWDTLGGLADFKNIPPIDTKLLCNTLAGKRLVWSFKDYLTCDFTPNLSNGAIFGKLCYGGKSRIQELNKLYPMLGFDIEIDNNFDVHPGGNKYGVPISQEGSGFLHLLEIFTKIMYCKENKLNLIIPGYDETLHPLVINRLEEYLNTCGVNIIASSRKI